MGLEPSLQVVLAQLAALIALIIGFAMNRPPRGRIRLGQC